MKYRRICTGLVAVLLGLGVPATSHAQFAWTGTVSSDWNVAGNWNLGVPINGSTVDLTGSGSSPTNYTLGARTFQSITLDNGRVGGYVVNLVGAGVTPALVSGGSFIDQNTTGPDTINTGLNLNGPTAIAAVPGATLIFATNPITGTGGVTVSGGGVVIFNTANTYTGTTLINGGTLIVNGSLPNTGNVIVNTAGTLGGTGSVGPTTVGGTIAPGATAGGGIGTLTINGAFVQNPNSIHLASINPAGQSSLVLVNGAANIAGSVQVNAATGTYTQGQRYTILTATGGVTGTYTGASFNNLPFFTPLLSYDANDVFLTVVRSATSYASVAQTYNQFQVASAFDRGSQGSTGDLATVIDALNALSAPQARSAFDAMSGEVYGSLTAAAIEKEALFLRVTARRLRPLAFAGDAGFDTTMANNGGTFAGATPVGGMNNSPNAIQPVNYRAQGDDNSCANGSCRTGSGFGCGSGKCGTCEAWMTQYGMGGNATGDGNAHDFNYNIYGFAVGTDYNLSDDTIVGMALGYSYFNVATQDVDGHANVNNVDLGVYAREYFGNLWFLGIAAASMGQYDVNRTIAFPGIVRGASSSADGAQGATYWEVGYSWNVGAWAVQPLAGLQYIYNYRHDTQETGAGAIDLNVNASNVNSFRSVVGSRFVRPIETRRGILAPEFRGMWIHEYESQNFIVSSSFAGIPGIQIVPQGLSLGTDFALLGTGFTWAVTNRISLGLHYDAYFSSNQFAQAGFGQFLYHW